VFLGTLILLGAVITGIVFAVRSEWDALVASAVTGWEELQSFVATGPLPINTQAIDAAAQQATVIIALVDAVALGVPLAIMGVPPALPLAVIQVWSDRYQAGEDPILGDDPLSQAGRAVTAQ
jgi:hypothetical protein